MDKDNIRLLAPIHKEVRTPTNGAANSQLMVEWAYNLLSELDAELGKRFIGSRFTSKDVLSNPD